MNHRLHITVLEYEQAVKFGPVIPTYAIRIFSSTFDAHQGRTWLPLQDPQAKYVHIDCATFDDITRASATQVLFDGSMARALILNFHQHARDCEQLLVHCLAGCSRSPAVALALNEIFALGHPPNAMKERFPLLNKHVQRTMLATGAALIHEGVIPRPAPVPGNGPRPAPPRLSTGVKVLEFLTPDPAAAEEVDLFQGVEALAASIAQGHGFEFKVILNADGMLVGPVTREHRTLSIEPVRYLPRQDGGNSGNALAGMILPQRIELRYDPRFPDLRVRQLLNRLAHHPRVSFLADFQVFYQARPLGPFRGERHADTPR